MSKGRTGSRRKRIPRDATTEQIQEAVRRGQQRYQAQTALRAKGGRPPRQTPADERREELLDVQRRAFIAGAVEHRNELAMQGWAPIGHDGRPTAWPAD